MIRSLVAGVTQTVSVQGERFYYKRGEHEIKVKIVGGGDSRDFLLREGMGFVCKDGEGFYSLEMTSSDDQDVEFEISYREVFDSGVKVRADGALPVHVTEGSIDINGLLQIVNNGGTSRGTGVVNVLAGVAKELRPLNANRLKVALSFTQNVYLGKDNTVNAANGFPLASGTTWVDENTSAIWVFCPVACDVPYLEDLK